jgi:hypothetical protein
MFKLVRNVDRKETSIINRTGKAVSDYAAASLTRRGMLFNVAAGAATLFGIKFAAPQVVDSFLSLPSAFGQATCTHATGCGSDALNCGMGNGNDCATWKNNDTPGGACEGCWNATTGCPVGLTKAPAGSGWSMCCKCVGNPAAGTKIHYYDCCGARKDMPRNCQKIDTPCWKKWNNNGNGTGCGNGANCTPDGGGGGANQWCGNVGIPFCSMAEDTGASC